MKYKDFSQSLVQDFFNENFGGDYDDEEYDSKKWTEMLNELNNDLLQSKIDQVNDCAEYLFYFFCDDAIDKLVSSHIIIGLFQYISYFTNTKIVHCTNPKERLEIAKHRELTSSLYLINECLRQHQTFNYEIFDQNIATTLFSIYEFSGFAPSAMSILILKNYGEHSLECLNNLMNLQYKERILKVCKKPLSIQARVCSIYALFPILNIPDTYYHRDLIEFLINKQASWNNIETNTAVLDFISRYITLSPNHLKNAVKLDIIDIAMSGLKVQVDNSKPYSIRKIALNIIFSLLNSPFPEHKTLIMSLNLIRIVSNCLDHPNVRADAKAFLKLLKFLLENDTMIIQNIEQFKIIPKLISAFPGLEFKLKLQLFEIFSLIILKAEPEMIYQICNSGIVSDLFDYIEELPPDLKELFLKAFYKSIMLDQCRSILMTDENIDILTRLLNDPESLNENIYNLIEMIKQNIS